MGFVCCNGFLKDRAGLRDNLILPISIVYLLFIVGGAFIIKEIEEPNDNKVVGHMKAAYQSFVSNQSRTFNETELRSLLLDVFGYLKNGENVDILWDEKSETRNWTLSESILFVVSILVMIGYGNMTPATAGGKFFVIVFAIFGIPLTLFLLTAFIDKLSSLTSKLLQCLTKNNRLKVSLAWFIYILTLVAFAFVFFFVIPAAIINSLESQWSFLDCFYYCFVSLTTIGFGDYVPGRNWKESNRDAYVVSIAFYLLVGVTIVMTVVSEMCRSTCLQGFLTRSTKSDDDDPNRPIMSENGEPSIKGYQSIEDS